MKDAKSCSTMYNFYVLRKARASFSHTCKRASDAHPFHFPFQSIPETPCPCPCQLVSVICVVQTTSLSQEEAIQVMEVPNHKLSLSKLNRSILRCRLTTPNLKNLSSPEAVRPPMYHFSAAITSRKPSDELSEPRLIRFSFAEAEFCI